MRALPLSISMLAPDLFYFKIFEFKINTAYFKLLKRANEAHDLDVTWMTDIGDVNTAV